MVAYGSTYLSSPTPKTSSLPDDQLTAVGALVNCPPRLTQSDQERPFHDLCQQASSVPMPKRSIRFGPQDTAEISEVKTPPRFSQVPPQLKPLFCTNHQYTDIGSKALKRTASEQTIALTSTTSGKQSCQFQVQRYQGGSSSTP